LSTEKTANKAVTDIKESIAIEKHLENDLSSITAGNGRGSLPGGPLGREPLIREPLPEAKG
jgi:hypothetical protein